MTSLKKRISKKSTQFQFAFTFKKKSLSVKLNGISDSIFHAFSSSRLKNRLISACICRAFLFFFPKQMRCSGALITSFNRVT